MILEIGAAVVSGAAGAWGGALVAEETGAIEWVGMGLGFLAGPTAIVITHLLTRRRLKAQDVKVGEVEAKVESIDVHVDGHLSSLFDRIDQLTQVIEGSNKDVPPEPKHLPTEMSEGVE